METGYKVFKSAVLKSVELKEKTFSFEPEVTIKLSKKNYKFFEVLSLIMVDRMRKEKNWAKRCIYCIKNYYFMLTKKII